MNFPSIIILIMSWSTLCVNFMLPLPSIDLLFLPKVSLPEYQFLPKFAHESLPRCFTWVMWFISIIMMVFNSYLSKHSWNTHFCSPNTPRLQPPGQPSLSLIVNGVSKFVKRSFQLNGTNFTMTGAPNWTVWQNIYSADIVSCLAKSVEQIMNLYKCGITFKIFFNKYVAS